MSPLSRIRAAAALALVAACGGHPASGQTAYFADGWHGGIWGHYPPWVTQFLVDQMKQFPDWKLNLEIEPETWDWIKANTPEAYRSFQTLFADQSVNARVEYINPALAQSYLWNITGESVIRQFYYGRKKVLEHFPNADLTVYSSEEPCFTSALPGILTGFGFRYAVLKNPNTCWGGYTRAFGGERVRWIGPDGTAIAAVPRYAVEALGAHTTWRTIASDNEPAYIQAAVAAGIADPVGMCLQDAGWNHGPRLGKNAYQPSTYVTWRNYFETKSERAAPMDWRFSQEDVLVSLMWGSQVLQKIAREVRAAENNLVQSEKLAAMAGTWGKMEWPQPAFDQAWRTLLLSEHHDCWITPYNRTRDRDSLGEGPRTLTAAGRISWAEWVRRWTASTRETGDGVAAQAIAAMSTGPAIAMGTAASQRTSVRVFNTLGSPRRDIVLVDLSAEWTAAHARVLDLTGKEVPAQLVSEPGSTTRQLAFRAEAPAMGYTTYQLEPRPAAGPDRAAMVTRQSDGSYRVETDLYSLILDPERGGTIRSIKAKGLGGREIVDGADARRFGELRGYFFQEGKFHSNADQPATVTVLESGPVRARVQIDGLIGIHPFRQVVSLAQGQRRVEVNLRIDWQGNPGIGAGFGQQNGYRREEPRRPFYDDRFKLLAAFPAKLGARQKIAKNAPFDVTVSRLADTVFDRWDAIKNNVVLNWVDATDENERYGLAVLTDHTTSYSHGEHDPLAITVQYSGAGLWGKNYTIEGPTEVAYAFIPHEGKWDRAEIWTESDRWNEPLRARMLEGRLDSPMEQMLMPAPASGWEVSAMMRDGPDLLVRFFNAEGDGTMRKLSFAGKATRVETVDLNGRTIDNLSQDREGRTTEVRLALPRFKVQTVRLKSFVEQN